LWGYWDHVRNYWDRLTQERPRVAHGHLAQHRILVSNVSRRSLRLVGKVSRVHMALVRRTKGEAVPLPDGVLARMQLSPYRVQLGGVRTTAVSYQPLHHEVHLVGFVEAGDANKLEPSAGTASQ